MIAIMILGIGVVMVATVFPVGIEMSRQPIQAYLSLAIADTAAATLAAKVPAFRELDQIYPNIIPGGSQRVLVADVAATDLDATMDNAELEVVNSLFPVTYPPASLQPVSYPNWQPLPSGTPSWNQGYVWVAGALGYAALAPSQQPAPPIPSFISRTRVFTERTGWSAEVDINNPLGLNGWNTMSPVPAQNLPADPGVRNTLFPSSLADLPSFLNAIPTIVDPSLAGTYQTDLPRISLVDQVYHPVTLKFANGSDRLWPDVLEELRTRLYSWAAFHHRMSSESPTASKLLTNRDILTTIATLHRTDIGARFARQKTLDKTGAQYLTSFDLNTGGLNFTDHYRAMYQPQADPSPATDAVFPRPWLAMIYGLDPQNARASVTPELARLLPAGSYFIIARQTGGTNGYYAGTFMQVTRNEYDATKVGLLDVDPANLGNYPYWTRIEVTRSALPPLGAVPVWVFPPAITTLQAARSQATYYDFATRSPVVGVELRRIAVQQ